MIELSNGQESQVTVTTKLNYWGKRTILEKKLLAAVVLVVGVILSFFIDAALYWHKKPTRPCYSDECIIASSDLLNQIDETVDPCDNFYKFACGKLEMRTHHNDVARNAIKKRVEKQVTNILTEPISDDDHPSLKYEKKLFAACRDEATDGTTLKGLKAILNDLGGWPVLMGEKWNESNFKIIDTIDKLKRVGLFHNMMLRVRLEEESPERNVTVSGPMLFPRDDKYLHLYKKVMIDQAIAVGANESVAIEEMSRAYDFMIELNKLNYVNENKTEGETLRLSILELQLNYKGMDWLKYLQLVQESTDTITEDDYVVFPYLNFPQQFLNLMSATNHRTLANYILWTAILSVSTLVSNELLDSHNQVLCIVGFPVKDRNAECLVEISKVMFPSPSYFVFLKRHMPTSTRKAVQEMFHIIFKELNKLISINSWIDEESKNKSYEWLKKVEFIVGFNATTVDDIYRKIYKPFNKNDSFLTSFLKLKKESLLEESTEEYIKNYTSMEYFGASQTEIFYWHGIIRVSAGLLQGIYFDENRPMYINYGVLGQCLGSAVVHTFIISISKLWSEETKKIFENIINCVNQNSKYFGDEEDIYYQKRFKVAEIIGAKLSYNAYESWKSENGEELNLIGLNYTNSQLFWIFTFADFCFEESYNSDTNFYSDSEVVRQNSHFANDFRCHLDSKMNSKNKCTLL